MIFFMTEYSLLKIFKGKKEEYTKNISKIITQPYDYVISKRFLGVVEHTPLSPLEISI